MVLPICGLWIPILNFYLTLILLWVFSCLRLSETTHFSLDEFSYWLGTIPDPKSQWGCQCRREKFWNNEEKQYGSLVFPRILALPSGCVVINYMNIFAIFLKIKNKSYAESTWPLSCEWKVLESPVTTGFISCGRLHKVNLASPLNLMKLEAYQDSEYLLLRYEPDVLYPCDMGFGAEQVKVFILYTIKFLKFFLSPLPFQQILSYMVSFQDLKFHLQGWLSRCCGTTAS